MQDYMEYLKVKFGVNKNYLAKTQLVEGFSAKFRMLPVGINRSDMDRTKSRFVV